MPSILIETRISRTPQEEQAIMDAVHGALREAFKIKSNDKTVRLVAHAPHRFACPADREKPELFTYVTIDAFSGRSLDAKRSLYQGIVDALEPLGIPKDHVLTVVREAPPSDWGIRGGQAACDVELGFKINV
jgi:phenylpyruvate tautomerase PptA (4-oxalocrotonate tautomerase family)